VSRRIAVVTGSRAEYGLLRWLMADIQASPALTLQVLATGMHLRPEFGSTVDEITADGFAVDGRIDIGLASDRPEGIAASMGRGLAGFGEAFAASRPDIVVVLGDRFEILPAVAAALVARIPVAHLHGGESTEGAFDESIRHAITKMSHLHCVAADAYARRVIQMGEDPARVFVVGGLGLDGIRRATLVDRPALEAALGLTFGPRSLLVTFHPATLSEESPVAQMTELLAALDALTATTLIFTMPNADTGGQALTRMVEQFVETRAHAHAFTSLGQQRYLSCMQFVDGVVGNSSSGLIEAPAMHVGTVNIGDRQRRRLKAESVIDCAPRRDDIGRAIAELDTPAFRARVARAVNPYGDGGASARVVRVLETTPLEGLIVKRFHDLPVAAGQWGTA
jgi:GDP/UDP-N,N'-diacetylbacillosamine 2-epimerase (hydrolysing)